MGRDTARARARRHPRTPLVALVVALLAAAGCASDPPTATSALPPGAFPTAAATGSKGDDPPARLTQIAAVGSMAAAMASTGDHLFVGLRTGQILSIPVTERRGHRAPSSHADLAFDLSKETTTTGERGLFALLPLGDHQMLASYSAGDGSTTVERFDVEGGVLKRRPHGIVLSLAHPYAGHNGGGMAFTDDGDLLIGIGDMNLINTPKPAAQDLTSPYGSIVRIPRDVVLGTQPGPFTITPDALVAKGLRNPWRISRDPRTDTLWIGDVGDDTWEEVNQVPHVTTTTAQPNFGWPYEEGRSVHRSDVPTPPPTFTPPVHVARHGEGTCAIVGGAVYRGKAIPALAGRYVFGDYCSTRVRAFDAADPPGRAAATLVSTDAFVVSLAQDEHGELYALDLDGNVSRLDPAGWTPPAITATDVPVDPQAPTTDGGGADEPLPPCEAVLSLLSLGSIFTAADPANEQRLTSVIDALARNEPLAATPELATDISVVHDALIALRDAARTANWDMAAEPAASLLADILAGHGTWTSFPSSLNALVTVSDCE